MSMKLTLLNKSFFPVLVTTLSLSVGLSACGGNSDKPAASAEPSTSSSPATTSAPAPQPKTWPLNGLEVNGEVGPAVAVKIENSKEARPQSGLEQTDLVWEELVEGGITRFIAVYNSQLPEGIGPIRSVRPTDSRILSPFGGLVVFSGGQAPFIQAVQDEGLQVISFDAGNAGFYRTKDRKAPHNVYGNLNEFLVQAKNTDPPATQFIFASSASESLVAQSTENATSIETTFSSYAKPNWTFDANSGKYLRFEGQNPANAKSGEQLSATNVVALKVPIVQTKYVDPAGTPVPDTQLIGEGEAVVFTGGKAQRGTWKKSQASSVLKVLTDDGLDITLAPGNTWVELVPQNEGVISYQ